MVLNNKPQMFCVYFPSNFFYKPVVEKWEPIVHRMKLPYETVDDFMNAQIQSLTVPSVSMDLVSQQRGQYRVDYQNGKELEPQMTRNLSMTFKLTESYLSYFIMWDQIDTFLHYKQHLEDNVLLWMEPIKLSFLNDAGFQTVNFEFQEITPNSLSELQLSYAASIASYSNFTFGFTYNRFDASF